MTRPFYVTTAISYPNGRPHVGHAYEAIAADAIARWHRLAGRDVRFLTGTDEHGLKMAQTARARGLEPRALADEMSGAFKVMADALNISYDRFIRTTDADHYAASAELWRRMEARGDVYLGRYEGWYSVRDEAFYAEDELLDGEGGRLSPQGTPVEWTVEESWFFRLSAYQDRLLAHYEAHPGFVRPEARRNEVASFVRSGLADLSISRTSFDWGVPVPGAPEHVMYVWVDALTNYLTGAGWPYDEPMAAKWWPASLHVIGKDIVRFHAVYWPAFLMSAGLPLPKAVFGHGFVLHRGEKMSKSSGNVADPHALAERYGVDGLRYFLLREVSFGQDGGYSDEAIVTRVNADLANGLGNLAQRCLSMIAKQCGGVVPEPIAEVRKPHFGWDIEGLLQHHLDDLRLHEALEAIWGLVREANGYFAEMAPWALRKSDPATADAVLYWTAEAVRQLAILVRWAVPASADALLDQLGQGADARDFAALATPLAPGTVLPQPTGVFPRLEVAAE
ncbi:methionine--tRNA ligase [Sphingomonas sp.]|uniref:methionine--tRNA ligase n=1 Tax=Sphingomonas sp. TaxID=28214 RepID=UPI003AFFFAE2